MNLFYIYYRKIYTLLLSPKVIRDMLITIRPNRKSMLLTLVGSNCCPISKCTMKENLMLGNYRLTINILDLVRIEGSVLLKITRKGSNLTIMTSLYRKLDFGWCSCNRTLKPIGYFCRNRIFKVILFFT